jgi:hypothetical protein
LHGIEIKCSRGDWLHELKRPDKADKMFKYFDRWWLAVSDESVAHDYEIPPTWGLIVMDKIKANAPILAPEPIDRKFLAAIMRRVYETSPEAKLAAEYARGKEDGYRDGYERGAKSGTAAANLDVLRRNVKAFEDSSGISIGEWNLGDVGRAARALATHGPKRLKANIEGLRNQLGRWAAGLRAARYADRSGAGDAYHPAPGARAAGCPQHAGCHLRAATKESRSLRAVECAASGGARLQSGPHESGDHRGQTGRRSHGGFRTRGYPGSLRARGGHGCGSASVISGTRPALPTDSPRCHCKTAPHSQVYAKWPLLSPLLFGAVNISSHCGHFNMVA